MAGTHGIGGVRDAGAHRLRHGAASHPARAHLPGHAAGAHGGIVGTHRAGTHLAVGHDGARVGGAHHGPSTGRLATKAIEK